ncbi:Gfo/Idh/MocA family oxidoreductase [Bengtsoniella intestinalis]|uniref:Gfo/Idh/MocA family protein n=1 Tax=Bengtsoniella intestinalis TaxID=3073143 RepID=UPI00391F7293
MNVAILGAGVISKKMAETIRGVDAATAYAVGARTLEKAQGFAEEFGFEKAYGSYAEMLADPAVELVYVATPMSHHYQHIKLCLEAGKHVLCEKSFTVNAAQAKELIALACEKKLLLAEAIWTRYLPSRKMIDDIIASGIIGEVTSLSANLGYNNKFKERIVKKELAGGALLDLGVYLLNFARMVVPDEVTKVVTHAVQTEDGVDMQDFITLHYQGGQVASLHSDTTGYSSGLGSINGTKAYLEVVDVNNPQKLVVYSRARTVVAEYDIPEQITGFEYELQACIDAIAAGQVECEAMPHSEIIYIMEQMDALRAAWGYEIPVM